MKFFNVILGNAKNLSKSTACFIASLLNCQEKTYNIFVTCHVNINCLFYRTILNFSAF